MKILITFLVLLFSSSVLADDISDFEIEGISIGDSLLEYYSKTQIKNANKTIYPTSNFFAAGHRIRLDISSSNFPRFDVNPNSGEPLGRNRRTVIADNTIFHCAEQPSHVILPIIPIQ